MAMRVGLAWIIVAIGTLLPGTCLATYLLAIYLGHLSDDPIFPYISDTGVRPPESCIFSQFFNLAAVFVCMMVSIHCCLVRHCLDDTQRQLINANRVALGFGLAMALGLSIVANFQVIHVFHVHIAGAMMGFFIGIVYAWIQTVISFWTCPILNSRMACYIRILFSTAASVTFIVSGISWWLSAWLTSSVSEWLMSFFLLIFFMTYFSEFRDAKMSLPVFTVRSMLVDKSADVTIA